MNQVFDFNRWWLLVGKQWSGNRKKYTLSLIAIAGLLLLWFIIVILSDKHVIVDEMQVSTYYTGLFLAGCLYGSILFTDLGSKTRGFNYLVVPASHFEKLLSALFYAVVLFFTIYTTIFYVLDFIMVKAGNAIAYSQWLKGHATGSLFAPAKLMNVFYLKGRPDEPNALLYLLLLFFVLQSVFIFGSIYFSRFSLIKTIIGSLLAGLLITFLLVKVIAPILPPGSYYNGITDYKVYTFKSGVTVNGVTTGISIYSDPETDKLVSLPHWIGDVLLFLLKFAFAPAFWIATYFRLKEKEI